ERHRARQPGARLRRQGRARARQGGSRRRQAARPLSAPMGSGKGTLGDFGARLAVGAPIVWLVVFFLVPFLIGLKISLSPTALALPPYVPVLDLSAGWDGIKSFLAGLGLDNSATLFSAGISGPHHVRRFAI